MESRQESNETTGIKPPTLEDWYELYTAAAELRKIEAWSWLGPRQMFGVQNPEDGDTGYCVLSGPDEKPFRLRVKMGAQGLLAHGLNLANDFPIDRLARLGFIHRTLFLHFTRRRSLTRRDTNVLKKLGLGFRGPDAWPQFRSLMVGYYPWYLTAEESRYFTTVLEQARDLAVRFMDDPALFEKPGIGVYLTRVPEFDGDVMRWKDMWLRPPPLVLKPTFMAPVDETRLEKIKETITNRERILELDACLIHGRIGGGRLRRPCWPRMLVFIDCTDESLAGLCCSEPWTYAQDFHDHLLTFIEKQGRIPLEIRVNEESVAHLFEPITSALGIRLRMVCKLDVLDRLEPWIREARIE